jgi:hypothetical protein
VAAVPIASQTKTKKKKRHRFHMERFSVNEIEEVEGKEQYRVQISNRTAVLENLRH